MAARLSDRRLRSVFMGDEHRAKIQNSNVLNRLIAHAQGECSEMTPSEVTASIALLRKCLPDLASVEHSGEVATAFVMRAPLPIATAEEWEQTQSPPTIQ